jgi:hypothetical protein
VPTSVCPIWHATCLLSLAVGSAERRCNATRPGLCRKRTAYRSAFPLECLPQAEQRAGRRQDRLEQRSATLAAALSRNS